MSNEFLFFFFFQAEDGIRDTSVTGVQTCALPICPDTPSFNVNSGVSGPLHSTPSAPSCSHTQCVWQNQSRQLPGCWSCSTVIRPSGTSTSTVGLRKANGNATYRASFSSVAVLEIGRAHV